MCEYCVIVHRGAGDHEDVPNGVRARDAPVRLEEKHAERVEDPTELQLEHRRRVHLGEDGHGGHDADEEIQARL